MAPPTCFHLLPGTTSADWVAWAARGAPWVKVADAESIAPARAAGAKVYYRPFLGGDDGHCPEAHAWANQVADSIHYTGGVWPDAIGFRNELPADGTTGQDYVTYRADLRARGYQGLVVLGSFSTGTPDFPPGTSGGNWDLLTQGLAGATPDAIELHEYWSDTCGDHAGWFEWRHVEAIKRGLLPASIPLFIGESGRDSPPGASPGGWQGVITAERERQNILAYRQGVAPSVVAVFSFADGVGQQWYRYDARGTAVETAIRSTWGMPLPPPPPPPAPGGHMTGTELAAYTYYTQRGVGIDPGHALWTHGLLPVYELWASLDAAHSPQADLCKPGPIVSGEYSTSWGGTRPAAAIRLSNRVIGVYQATDGSWVGYQVELF